MKEIWKTIYIDNEATSYEISNLGRVKSHYYNKVRYLKYCSKSLYFGVNLKHKGKQYQKYIHRLVSEYFLNNYNVNLQVNHKDLDKKNNIIDNLEMVTNIDNMHHAFNHKDCIIKRNFSDNDILYIRNNLHLKDKYFSSIFGVSKRVVNDVRNYKTYKWVK